MRRTTRTLVPWLILAGFLAGLAWALTPDPEPPADFSFSNMTEIKSVDPAIVTGQPEGRIIHALYEGLLDWHPQDLHPVPGVAYKWELSDDKRRWTFYLREDARWSDGTPVTAGDFVYSFRRFLDPMTAAEYAPLLYYVRNAERYNRSQVEPGDRVEVELLTRAKGALPFARNAVLHGQLVQIETVKLAAENGSAAQAPAETAATVYHVNLDGKQRRFTTNESLAASRPDVEACRQLLLDFREVGIRAEDDRTLAIELDHPVPYFLQLMGFYPLFPVSQRCVETYGYPAWTKPENIVTNGPFRLHSRQVRGRIRMVKNSYYWDREHVYLNIIDAYAVESQATALNMYLTGQLDWIPEVPVTVIPELLRQDREDFNPQPYLSIYFYRINTTRPPLNDVRVRRALSLAVNREEIVTKVTRAGELPAERFVPPGLADYDAELERHREKRVLGYDPERARQLLAEAGYPNGRGFPKIELLYNSHETHAQIAELVQSQWKEVLGINIELVNKEWGSYQADQSKMQYDIARAGWIGDYADPNTFLDLFLSDNPQNQTGWTDSQFDQLIRAAGVVELEDEERAEVEQSVREMPEWSEARHDELLSTALDRAINRKRMVLFFQAEERLLEELPVLPLFDYVTKGMVRPYVSGLYQNIRDSHPYRGIKVDQKAKRELLRREGLE